MADGIRPERTAGSSMFPWENVGGPGKDARQEEASGHHRSPGRVRRGGGELSGSDGGHRNTEVCRGCGKRQALRCHAQREQEGSWSAMPSPRDPMNSADALGGGPRGLPRPIKAALHFCGKPSPPPVSGQK